MGFALFAAILTATGVAFASPTSFDKKADDLVSRMTLDMKNSTCSGAPASARNPTRVSAFPHFV